MKKKMHKGALLLMVLGLALTVVLVGCKEESKSSEKNIIEFSFGIPGETIAILADQILYTLPRDTSLARLKPVIKVSEKATVTPGSEEERDFRSPVDYVVKAEDGSTKTYTVKLDELSSENSILTFSINGVAGKIGDGTYQKYNTNNIYVTLPLDTNITALKPVITVSDGAIVTPASEEAVDFSAGYFTYQVTAANGWTNDYTVYLLFENTLNIGFVGQETIVLYDSEGEEIDLSKPIELLLDEETQEEIVIMFLPGIYSDVQMWVNGRALVSNSNIFMIKAIDYYYDQPQYVDIQFTYKSIVYLTSFKFVVVKPSIEEDEEEEE